MRAPISKKQSKAQNIAQKKREHFFDFKPKPPIVHGSPNYWHLNVKNHNCHNNSEDSIGKLI